MMIHGGLVMDSDDEMYDVAVLLLSTLVKTCSYQYYPHSSALNPRDKHDFLIITHLDTLKTLVNYYQQANSSLPTIIHLVKPEDFATLQYDSHYDHLKIIPVLQSLNDVSGTLQFDSFYQAIHNLRQQQRGSVQ